MIGEEKDDSLPRPDGWPDPLIKIPVSPAGSVMQDYTLENSIRMGVAGLVFLILLVILAEAWWNQEKVQQAEVREISGRTL